MAAAGFEPPDAGVFDDPLTCVQVNQKWVSHIIGLLSPMTEPDYWDGDEATKFDLTMQAHALLSAIVNGNCP